MNYWAIWLMVVILLILIEAATVNLVSIWFIASGIITLFLSFLVSNFYIQFAVFVVLGIIFLVLTRPMLLKMQKEKEIKMNLDRILGMTGVVTQKILPNQTGEVKVDGKLWSAIASKKIEEGKMVTIKDRKSVKLVVEPVIEKEDLPKRKTASKKKSTNGKKINKNQKKGRTK